MLIHQYHRGAHESSSTFGQWLHRRITADTSFVDIDHQSVDNAHLEDTIHWLHFTPNDAQRLTVLEHKKPGTELSEAQRNILPVWRRLITLGIHDGLISWRSGLFIVEAGPPWTRFDVSAHAEDMHGSPTMVSMPLTERQMVTLAGGPRRGSVFWGRA
jgi:hypothetical protein